MVSEYHSINCKSDSQADSHSECDAPEMWAALNFNSNLDFFHTLLGGYQKQWLWAFMARSESPEMCLVYSNVEAAHLISELLPAPGDDDDDEDQIVNTFVIHTA